MLWFLIGFRAESCPIYLEKQQIFSKRNSIDYYRSEVEHGAISSPRRDVGPGVKLGDSKGAGHGAKLGEPKVDNFADVRLIAFKEVGKTRRLLPSQIDFLDEEKRLSWRHENNFRLVIEKSGVIDERYRSAAEDDFSCQRIQKIVRVETNEGEFYVGNCWGLEFGRKNPVNHDGGKQLISSRRFQFFYNSKNHILFDRIEMKTNLGIQKIAHDSSLKITALMKNFFDLEFDRTDITSEIVDFRQTKISFQALLNFYLNILFFKINLHLATRSSFYESSVHIPMILHLPVDAEDWVTKNSGVAYSWRFGNLVELLSEQSRIPMFGEIQTEDLTKVYCMSKECVFTLVGQAPAGRFVMYFKLSPELVKRGFYPQLAKDSSLLAKSLGFSDAFEGNVTTLFFETHRLKEGNHEWDFWIDLQTSGEKRSSGCPTPVLNISPL